MDEIKKSTKGSEIFVRLRRSVAFLMASIILIVMLIIGISYLNSNGQKDSAELINVLGKQRMLSQLLAKEANRISVLQSAKASPDSVEPKEVHDEKIAEAIENIKGATLQFDNTFNEIVIRKLQNGENTGLEKLFANDKNYENINELGKVWNIYKFNLDTVMEKNNTEDNFKRALIYINENDSKLLALSDALTNEVLEISNLKYALGRDAALVLLVILAVFAIYTLRKFYIYLFKPLEELYSGFASLGVGFSRNGESGEEKEKDSIRNVTVEIRGLFTGIREMLELVENINKKISFNDSLNYIFETFSKFVPYTYIGIALFASDGSNKLKASYGVCGKYHKGMAAELVGLTVELEKTSLWKLVESGKPRIINDLDEYFKNRTINSYSKILLDNGIKASITLPLMVSDEHIGFIFFSSNKANVYSPNHVTFLESVGSAIAMSMEKNIFIDELVYSSVLALAKLAEAKDEETGEHIDRMRNYACKLAGLLKNEERFSNIIDPEFLMGIEKFSPMHDIGKVGIPDGILLKPGKLTEEEFKVMKSHPLFGAEVLRKAEENINRKGRSIFGMGIDIANYHHEKWNGSEYPTGLAGDDIPLAARIAALADVLDALLSNRPYKRAFSFEESAAIISEGKGSHFDPLIVDVFEKNLDEFRKIYEESRYE